MSWIQDIVSPKTRQWEEFFDRRRLHFDVTTRCKSRVR